MDLLKFLLAMAALLGAVRVAYIFRARSMRRFAARWNLRYIGPTVPRQWWFNTSRLEPVPPVPDWISQFGITQIWNVIEGLKDGKPIIIFDSIVGDFKSHPRTFVLCQTGLNPFGTTTSTDRVVQTHGWTVLHGVWFLWFCWTMGTTRLDKHLSKLRFE